MTHGGKLLLLVVVQFFFCVIIIAVISIYVFTMAKHTLLSPRVGLEMIALEADSLHCY